ncbi:hypothetical protein V493_00459, partial [Pseudogymnoascus sp. VKM F-4281 (FW-2241)]
MQQPMDLDPEAPPTHHSDKSDNNSTALHAKTHDAPPSSGHPSPAPSSNSTQHNELYERELSNFNAVLASISPAAARAGVRQNWRKCLLGSSSDESFFIRSLMGRTSDHVMTKILEDEQERILEVASEHYKEFLDQAMAVRLESISAKELVAVLAKARRLGYDEMDLVEADEMVVPVEGREANEPSDTEEEADESLQVEVPEVLEVESGAPKDSWAKERLMEFRMKQHGDAHQGSQTVFSQTEGHTKRKSKRKVCPACGATFLQSAGLKYHMDRKVCERQRPTAPLKFWCDLCSKGFTTSGGLTYHRLNNVCKGNETSATTSPSAQLQAEQATKYTEPPRNLTPKDIRKSEPFPGALNVRTYSPPQNAQMPAARFSEFKASPKPLPMHPSPQQYQPHSTPTSGPKPSVALTPEQYAEMNAKLEKEERRFESVLAKVSPHLSSDDRHAEIKRLKAGSSTRKSIIRREYGVQVRRSKVATANAIRTASGGVDVSMVDTPPSTNGFAAINRIASFRAEPIEPDSKRRRTGEVEVRGRNPSMYDPLRDDSDRSRSVDEYPRPGFNDTQRPTHPSQVLKSDNRPTTAQRQNGIIPRSRPPLHAERSSHGTPQHDPYRQSSYHQHQTPTGGFTSVNTEQSGSTPRDRHDGHTAPLARMGTYAAAPFYVDQDGRSHALTPYNPEGTFGVLKSKKVPVREAQVQWENLQNSGRGAHYGGPLGQANGAEKRGSVTTTATTTRTGDLIEILSDSSSYSHTPPNEKLAAKMAHKDTSTLSSAASSIPPEARQSAGIGGRPTAPMVHSSPHTRSAAEKSEGRGAVEEESDSDDGSDTSIPARRTPVKNDANRPRDTLSVQPKTRAEESDRRLMQALAGKYGDEKENRGFRHPVCPAIHKPAIQLLSTLNRANANGHSVKSKPFVASKVILGQATAAPSGAVRKRKTSESAKISRPWDPSTQHSISQQHNMPQKNDEKELTLAIQAIHQDPTL